MSHRKNQLGYQSDREMIDSLSLWSKRLGVEPMNQQHNIDVVNRMTPDNFDPFLDEDFKPTAYDGEPSNEDGMILLEEERVPRYLIELEKLEIPVNDKLALLSVYESAENPAKFDEYLNTTVMIYGGIVWHHPPFVSNGKGRDKDGNIVPVGGKCPGYDQIRMITIDDAGKIKTICASYGALAGHINGILTLRGWYLWDEPVPYKFSRHRDTGAFQIVNADRVAEILKGKKK